MEFIKLLNESEESKRMAIDILELRNYTYEEHGFRHFDHLIIDNDVRLSIQANFGTYCTPRKTVAIEEYSAMEFALFKNDEFVNVRTIIQNEILTKKLNEYYNGTVYCYVPVELIEEMYLELTREK